MPAMSTTKTTTPDSTPPVGLATTAGLAATAGQFAAALVVVFAADGSDRLAAIAPLVTATVTLVTVLGGRYVQAKAAIGAAPFATPAAITNTVAARPLDDGDAQIIEAGGGEDDARDLHDGGMA
jgi:hypothetical protein